MFPINSEGVTQKCYKEFLLRLNADKAKAQNTEGVPFL